MQRCSAVIHVYIALIIILRACICKTFNWIEKILNVFLLRLYYVIIIITAL